jgi:hypothetical protein
MSNNVFQWYPKPATVQPPKALSPDERKAAAWQEAFKCLQDPDADNTLLAPILRAKYNISVADAAQAVQDAQAAIVEGNDEER